MCGGVEIKGFPLHFIYLHLPQIRKNVGCASLLHCHPLTWLEEEQSRLVFLSAWHRHKSEPHLWKKLPFPLLILWKVWFFTFFNDPSTPHRPPPPPTGHSCNHNDYFYSSKVVSLLILLKAVSQVLSRKIITVLKNYNWLIEELQHEKYLFLPGLSP